MSENEQFRNATNFLKSSGKGNLGDIARAIGIKREEMDRLRFGGKKVSSKIIKDLCRTFPEVTLYFADPADEGGEEIYNKLVSALEETIALQKEVIDNLRQQLKKTRKPD